jgi:trk system potassium uptake protein TrkH
MIQLGGLGLMTFSMAIAVLLGKKLNFESKSIINKFIDYDNPGYTVFILKKVITFTLATEIIGFLLLIIGFNINGINDDLIFTSLFHSVSAFCNAGFSTFSDSLCAFKGSYFINSVISFLIISGGIGFIVVIELYAVIRRFFTGEKQKLKRFSVQAKIMFVGTLFLIVFGFLAFLLFENANILKGEPISNKFIISMFQSITTRTAGFNTVDIGALLTPTLLIFVLLMFVGAGPGGTAGGIKITTVYIFLKSVSAMVKNEEDVNIFGRKIPSLIVRKATAVFFIAIFLNFTAILILSITEKLPLIKIIFEVVSAFGTVGLSTGITSQLTSIGKIVITALMFIGRLGPVTVAFAFSKQNDKKYYSLPEEKVMIG